MTVEVIHEIAKAEVRKLRLAELGVVKSVFPHSDASDKHNYECNVELKNNGLELQRVPVATQHIGLANIPNVGDLVIVSYLNGDINSPMVTGRLYNDEDRPPVNKPKEFLLEFPSGLRMRLSDNDIVMEAGRSKMTIKQNGDIVVESAGKIDLKASGDLSISATNIKIKSTGETRIESGTSLTASGGTNTTLKGLKVSIKGMTEFGMPG